MAYHLTRDDFPTSPLAYRTADPARQAKVRAFADQQAAAANRARDRLTVSWKTATRGERSMDLREAYSYLIDWRYRLAAATDTHLGGQSIGHNAERFRTPIRPGDINYDRLGYVGRLRDGAEWDPSSRTYIGGVSTPAHEAMLMYGRAAEERFEREEADGDVLQNWVTLPNGARVRGNRILRGAAAHAAASELAARVAARGLDASRMETGGHPLYTATPEPPASAALRAAAFDMLAAPDLTEDQYLNARYLLFQAPRTKKGSDAVTRTFIVAVGALHFGAGLPPLPADIDLRCYVLGQAAVHADPSPTTADGADLRTLAAGPAAAHRDGCDCSTCTYE